MTRPSMSTDAFDRIVLGFFSHSLLTFHLLLMCCLWLSEKASKRVPAGKRHRVEKKVRPVLPNALPRLLLLLLICISLVTNFLLACPVDSHNIASFFLLSFPSFTFFCFVFCFLFFFSPFVFSYLSEPDKGKLQD